MSYATIYLFLVEKIKCKHLVNEILASTVMHNLLFNAVKTDNIDFFNKYEVSKIMMQKYKYQLMKVCGLKVFDFLVRKLGNITWYKIFKSIKNSENVSEKLEFLERYLCREDIDYFFRKINMNTN